MDPSTVAAMLKLALMVKKSLDQSALLRQVGEIEKSVDAIGRHLAEDVMVQVRVGFTHLRTAIAVSPGPVRELEFTHARATFAKLAERRGGDGLIEKYHGISWRHVAALGYLGNYSYFLLQDQPELALINAYSSAEMYPSMAVTVLPRELFSAQALQALPGRSPDQIRVAYAKALATHRENQREYRLDLAWRVPAAAAYVLGGLAAATVAPPMAAAGLRGATGLLAGSSRGLLPESGPSRQGYLAELTQTELSLAPIVQEARERRAALEARL